jgi:hypothetical protein
MFRFSLTQLFFLAVGFSLITTSVVFDEIAVRWDQFLYPNAVKWRGMRIVPGEHQQISTPDENMLVVKDNQAPMARLTLFLRPDDGVTPQALVKDLCSRDSCNRAASPAHDRAVANYRIDGEPMQIMLIRPGGGEVWIEFKGPPVALQGFVELIDSVTTQLAQQRANPSG